MGHPRRFRFAAQLNGPFPDRSWTDSVRELEALGYATVFVPDHFAGSIGPIAAMAAAAAATTTLRVGSLVFACDYRHPVVLAREMATIDQISRGRLEVGIGAGWMKSDYETSGIAMDPPKVRVDRMIEYATALRGLWSGESFSMAGEHFQITELVGTPEVHTPGGPKLLIGGGQRRVLGFAGAVADIVGVNPSIHSGAIDAEAARDAGPDRIDQKLGFLRDGAGDRFDDLELNAWLAMAEITDGAAEFAEMMGPAFGISPAEFHQSPMALVGTETEVAERLHERRERWGYSYTVIPGDKARDFAPVVAALTGT